MKTNSPMKINQKYAQHFPSPSSRRGKRSPELISSEAIYPVTEEEQRLAFEREYRQREENQETTTSEDLMMLRLQLQAMSQREKSAFSVSPNRSANITPGDRRINSPPLDQSHLPEFTTPSRSVNYLDKVIDGGWGWLVVLGSFVFICLVDGICFSCGLLVPELQVYYNIDKLAFAMLPTSFITGMCILTGPLASLMANSFEYRLVAVCGCVGITTVLAVCSFVYNFIIFIVLFGIIGGFSVGLIYLPAIAVVSNWFQVKRALAVGLVLCGSGIGIILFSETTPYALINVSYVELMVIWACVCAQCLIAVGAYRPLDVHQRILSNATRRRKQWLARERLRNIEKEKKKLERMKKLEAARAKKTTLQRGNIMDRIIQDKLRNMRNSSGSLDSMVITPDGQVIRALPGQYAQPMLSDDMIARIAESVLKRGQRRFSTLKESYISDEPVVDKSNLDKESITQIVRDYVSQWSLQQAALSPVTSRLVSGNNSYNPRRRLSHYVPIAARRQRRASEPDNLAEKKRQASITGLMINLSNQNDYTDSDANTITDFPPNNMPSELDESENSNFPFQQQQQSARINVPKTPEDILKTDIQAALMKELNRPMYKKDMFFSGSRISMAIAEADQAGGAESAGLSPWQRMESANEATLKSRCQESHQFLCNMFQTELLRSPTFCLLSLACIFSMFGFYIPFHYLPSYLDANELTETGHILSFMGVANIIGRLLATIYMEKDLAFYYEFLDSLWIHNFTLALAAASILAMSLMSPNFTVRATFAATYSGFMAITISLKSFLVVELFGIDRLTNAFSYLLLFQGVAVIISTPLSVYLIDVFEKRELPFHFCASSLILSLLCHLPLRYVADWERNRLEMHYLATLDVEGFVDDENSPSRGEQIFSNSGGKGVTGQSGRRSSWSGASAAQFANNMSNSNSTTNSSTDSPQSRSTPLSHRMSLIQFSSIIPEEHEDE